MEPEPVDGELYKPGFDRLSLPSLLKQLRDKALNHFKN